MLSLTRDLLRKTRDKNVLEIKPLTVCFWSDFAANPAVMYGLFEPNSQRLIYDSEKVNVVGNDHGICNQVNVINVEELDVFHEQALGLPLLIRVWAEFTRNDYVGPALPSMNFEGDLAMLIDTSHPMIRPALERALERARKILQSHGRFCIQIDLSTAIERWLKTTYPQHYCSMCRWRSHQARLYITNYVKPAHVFDCSSVLCMCATPCWILTAPFYKLYRRLKCHDIVVRIGAPVVRRTTLPISGKVIEVTQCRFLCN